MSEIKISSFELPENVIINSVLAREGWLMFGASPEQFKNSLDISKQGLRQALGQLKKLNYIQALSALSLPVLVSMESKNFLINALIVGGFFTAAGVIGMTERLRSKPKENLEYFRKSLLELEQIQVIRESLS